MIQVTFCSRCRIQTARPGFTVTEVLVYMVILTVLMGMAYPSVARQLATSKLEAAAYTISTDLETAFSLAARQRRPVTWNVDATQRRYMVLDRATSTVLLDRPMSDKDSPWGLTALKMSTGPVTIFPNGLASQATSIDLGLANQVRRVTLSRTGLVRIAVP